MNNQNLFIHEKFILYDILIEIKDQFQFSILKFNDDNLKKKAEMSSYNSLFITNKKIKNINNQIVLNTLPINIFQLTEKINLNFLKLKFKSQSNIVIGKYSFDLNAREMISQNYRLKLTEMEIKAIRYLFNINKPASVNELRLNVWVYQSELETHTVETHIYRLRKKIFKKFNDNQFITSTPSGYQIS